MGPAVTDLSSEWTFIPHTTFGLSHPYMMKSRPCTCFDRQRVKLYCFLINSVNKQSHHFIDIPIVQQYNLVQAGARRRRQLKSDGWNYISPSEGGTNPPDSQWGKTLKRLPMLTLDNEDDTCKHFRVHVSSSRTSLGMTKESVQVQQTANSAWTILPGISSVICSGGSIPYVDQDGVFSVTSH